MLIGRDHLKQNGESYQTHASFAFRYGWKLLIAAITSFVHGICPGLFKFHSAQTVIEIYQVIQQRNRPGESYAPDTTPNPFENDH